MFWNAYTPLALLCSAPPVSVFSLMLPWQGTGGMGFMLISRAYSVKVSAVNNGFMRKCVCACVGDVHARGAVAGFPVVMFLIDSMRRSTALFQCMLHHSLHAWGVIHKSGKQRSLQSTCMHESADQSNLESNQ